jgi:hypothetical protein
MNQDLAIAFNRARYFKKKMIIEYRLHNNSIYQSEINYREADSLEDFKERMIKADLRISYAKIYTEEI